MSFIHDFVGFNNFIVKHKEYLPAKLKQGPDMVSLCRNIVSNWVTKIAETNKITIRKRAADRDVKLFVENPFSRILSVSTPGIGVLSFASFISSFSLSNGDPVLTNPKIFNEKERELIKLLTELNGEIFSLNTNFQITFDFGRVNNYFVIPISPSSLSTLENSLGPLLATVGKFSALATFCKTFTDEEIDLFVEVVFFSRKYGDRLIMAEYTDRNFINKAIVSTREARMNYSTLHFINQYPDLTLNSNSVEQLNRLFKNINESFSSETRQDKIQIITSITQTAYHPDQRRPVAVPVATPTAAEALPTNELDAQGIPILTFVPAPEVPTRATVMFRALLEEELNETRPTIPVLHID